MATTLAKGCSLASDRTKTEAAQALSSLTAKLAQQAKFLTMSHRWTANWSTRHCVVVNIAHCHYTKYVHHLLLVELLR